MEKKNNALLWMLVLTAVLIAGLGGYLKNQVLAPLDLYQEEPVVAVPFLLLSDEEARQEIRMAGESRTLALETEPATEAPTEVPTQAPTEVPTEAPTEPSTEPPTEPIVIDESWFDDALFIGDSRTEGLKAYAPLGKAHYFCDTGMTFFNVLIRECSSEAFSKTDLEGLLTEFQYGKIYINLGINGMHKSHEDSLAKCRELIELIREKQPDTVIVLHSIMTVGRKKAASRDYFSVENIYALNEKISELAVGENIFYIDVNEWVADEEGYLPDEMSKDGCHLYGKEYLGWAQWLMDSAASFGIR